jgi:hypothetical protein
MSSVYLFGISPTLARTPTPSAGWIDPEGIDLAGVFASSSTASSTSLYRYIPVFGCPWLRLVYVAVSLILRRRIILMTRKSRRHMLEDEGKDTKDKHDGTSP